MLSSIEKLSEAHKKLLKELLTVSEGIEESEAKISVNDFLDLMKHFLFCKVEEDSLGYLVKINNKDLLYCKKPIESEIIDNEIRKFLKNIFNDFGVFSDSIEIKEAVRSSIAQLK